MASEIEMSAGKLCSPFILWFMCRLFLAVCVLPKNSREKLCVLHLSNKRANGVRTQDRLRLHVHKTNRRDTDWAREHGTAHTTFNKTIKHKFSMLQPLSCVPGEARGKMSRPTWDRMRHNSITDCAIVRVSPATTKEEEKKRSIRLFSMVWFGCIAAGVALTTFTALLLYYSDWINRYTWDTKTQPAFSSRISRVCLSGTIDEWFVWDSGIRCFFCCIDVDAPSIGKHCRLEIVDFRLLSLSWKSSREDDFDCQKS